MRPEECNSSLFPNRESRMLFGASLGSLTGSIALHSVAASSATLGASGETVQTETASCRPLGVNKAFLRELHCQEEFFCNSVMAAFELLC